jgi:hypothetical protein
MGIAALQAAGDEPAWVYDDGGQAESRRAGKPGDGVARAVAIATGVPYDIVASAWTGALKRTRPKARNDGSRPGTRTGTPTAALRLFLCEAGWVWTPSMHVGTRTRVHLRADELPAGWLIARLLGQVVAVCDGVSYDTTDPTRGGARCVYGYWSPPTGPPGIPARS